ncbi:hypothetical protein DSO57_1019894 [Entomophthora muscae]|uniref:Uncharacterized protein n=1 Tax=Entomophthora muscae TaxID=34485 RepID=A0ACC2TEU0_9FUNG|nr:hypothetical protein DSO57_1019894 [Entomophthora muscae]
MPPKTLFSTTKFKPGSVNELADIDLNSNVNSSLNQSLPLKLVLSQSMIDNYDSNCPVLLPGDVDSKDGADNVLCLVSGLLVAFPSVVLCKSPPDASVSVGKPYQSKTCPTMKDQADEL